MKILIVTPYLPYPNAPHGGGAVLFSLIYHLNQRHTVLLASMYEEHEAEKLSEIGRYAEVVCAVQMEKSGIAKYQKWLESEKSDAFIIRSRRALRSMLTWGWGKLTGTTVIANADEIKFFSQLNARLPTLAPDVVQVEFTRACILAVKQLTVPSSVPKVAVPHDVSLKPARRFFEQATSFFRKTQAYFSYLATRDSELSAYQRYDIVCTHSRYDQQLLASLLPDCRVEFRPAAVITEAPVRSVIQREPMRVLFVGALYRKENIEALQFMLNEVWEKVLAACPAAEFHIVGKGAPESLLRHQNQRGVFFHGYAASLAELYRGARVMVAPLFVGGGFIIKVFEALSYALPTVASTIANEGLGARNGEEILLADTADDFAAAIIRLLTDDALWNCLSRQGQALIQTTYNFESIIDALEADYTQLLERRRADLQPMPV